ncbi:hypothetical protein NDU88_005684 [Pleurodeles waltl]|uniref:Uncharacterized protein n=1 Tax=Pleurodeles waltl TaxID=8319 RepID=A0AAV7VMP2_PLEWA|nr:hypothetical protein NDU88_005684 [Pleurodeles waltl]
MSRTLASLFAVRGCHHPLPDRVHRQPGGDPIGLGSGIHPRPLRLPSLSWPLCLAAWSFGEAAVRRRCSRPPLSSWLPHPAAWSFSVVSSWGKTRKAPSQPHSSGRSDCLLYPGRLVLRASPWAWSARPWRSWAAAGRLSFPGRPVPRPGSQARPTQPQRHFSPAGCPPLPGRYVLGHEPPVGLAGLQRSSNAAGCRGPALRGRGVFQVPQTDRLLNVGAPLQQEILRLGRLQELPSRLGLHLPGRVYQFPRL